jgi:hypothetical protein
MVASLLQFVDLASMLEPYQRPTQTVTSSNYLSVGKPVLLTPVATDEFEIAGPREDRLHIDRDATGSIVGIGSTRDCGRCTQRGSNSEPSPLAAFQLPLCEVNEVFTDR